jgi:hypothetical protein
VSERLIDRIDEMLGRPAVDPHGDPIPDSDGIVSRARYDTLLTCPVQTPVTVRRVSDQDPEFLRFVERHELRPGQVVEVDARDDAADSVRLRAGEGRAFTIGARAASKVLVQAARVVALLMILVLPARAQAPAQSPAATESESPFQIEDNSFFVEEAFNQEARVFQNIFGVLRQGGQWAASFTQEWPAPNQKHQLSYTVAFQDGASSFGAGDTLVNYRYQVWDEADGRPAFSPRASLVLPTGSVDQGRGNGSYGLQINLPFSKRHEAVYWHWNAGLTWRPRAEVPPSVSAERASLVTPFLAGSAIYALRPMLNLMLENVLTFDSSFDGQGKSRTTEYTLAPGVRGGWNVPNAQIVVGAAVPITWAGGDAAAGLFLYFSYEITLKK